MLASSFVLLKGIGQSSERRLWQEGILDWASFLRAPTLPGISSTRKEWYDRELATAQLRLEEGDAHFFSTCLKSREHWRLFETFRPRTLYLDIETTGTPAREGHVTVVGLYRNGRMTSLVRGETLHRGPIARRTGADRPLHYIFRERVRHSLLAGKVPSIKFQETALRPVLCGAEARHARRVKTHRAEIPDCSRGRCGGTRWMGSRSPMASVVRGRRSRTRSIAAVQRSRYPKPRTACIIALRPDVRSIRPVFCGVSTRPSPKSGRGCSVTELQQWTGVGRTETGYVRASNQDALALLNDCGVWIVADGMGGHPAGDIAAQTAVAVATQRARERASWLHEHPSNAAEFMTDLVTSANRRIHDLMKAKPSLRGMGTTLVALAINRRPCRSPISPTWEIVARISIGQDSSSN